ncbi:MAG: family 20 glycosylhydrolase [Armatimonadota bacterium]
MLDHLSRLFPAPRVVMRQEGNCPAGVIVVAEIPAAWQGPLATEMAGLHAGNNEHQAGTRTRLLIIEGTPSGSPSEQAYDLTITSGDITLVAHDIAGARYGLRTLSRLLSGPSLPCCTIHDWPEVIHRGVQFDLGRVIERPDTIKRLLPLYASMNYNVIQLYFENAFIFPSHPKLARKFAWTLEQAWEVVEAAREYGMTAIPAIQALGHCNWVGSHPDYAEFDEGYDAGKVTSVLCPSHPGVLDMLQGMITDVAPLATAGIIHLGMDESFAIGRCSRCAPRREQIGEGGIYFEHANRVAAFTRAAGKRPAIWGDMFYYYPDDVAKLDKDILIFDWYYYIFERYPRVELFGFEEMDTQTLWKENGLESWGCPMSICPVSMPFNLPEEAIENSRSWQRYLRDFGSQGIMVTQWELSSTSVDFCPPVEAAIAGLLWGSDEDADTLFGEACAVIYDRPRMADLLSELGEYRLHGHNALRWLRSPSLTEMIAYDASAEDQRRATRLEHMAQEIAQEAEGARHAEMAAAFVPAARWLSYQYQKRVSLKDAAMLVADKKYSEAKALLFRLEEMAALLAPAWQAQWDRNRYPEDAAPLPTRLQTEVAMYREEMAALETAAAGQPYAGKLEAPIIAVQLVNSHPAIPYVSVAISVDGESFTDCGRGTILQFDSKAARPTSDDVLTYNFPIDAPESARFIKVTASGDGQFHLKNITLHYGKRVWTPRAVQAEGRVENAEAILTGGLAQMGHQDPKALYYELLAEGDSSRIFSVVHGSLTAKMAEVK